MEIIPLALLGIIILAGLVAFGVGHKGWSWGTIAAAILVLLSATGFLVLAARLDERERTWRAKVRNLEAEIAKERDGMRLDDKGRAEPMPGTLSIAGLEDQRARWYRALERVNTWRGRVWNKNFFHPPEDAKPGRLVLELPEGAAPNPFIHAGSQLFLFDDESADDGGRFLGVFRVSEAKIDQGDLVLSVEPAAAPGDAQRRLWRRDYESVQVFESLPVDRWLAFSRTVQPDDEGDEEAESGPGGSVIAATLPRLRRAKFSDDSSAEDLLKDLEEQLARFEKHETPVPEDEWRPLADSDALPPGRYWASVTFTSAHAMTTKEAGRDEKSLQFEKGDASTLELSTALRLAEEGVVTIRNVVYRRPLADVETALQGSRIPVSPQSTVEVQGWFTMRRILENEVARATQAVSDLKAAKKNAMNTVALLEKEQGDLRDDLPLWKKDATVAADVADAMEVQLTAASEALDRTWEAVIQLGREYDGTMALLQADARKRAGGTR